jgi:hypothetical protein
MRHCQEVKIVSQEEGWQIRPEGKDSDGGDA